MSTTKEQLLNSQFYVELKLDGSSDLADGTFLDCQGLTASQEVVEFAEVTPQKWGQGARYGRVVRTKLPGNTKANNLVLRRGMTNSITLWRWFEAVREGNWKSQRRNGSVTIYDRAGDEQARFEFFGAWPANYKAADLSASGTEMEIEELEIAVESLKRIK